MPSLSSRDKGTSAFRKTKHRHRRDRDDSDSDQPSSFSQTLSSFISPRVSTLTSVAPPMVLPPAPPPAPTPPPHNLAVNGNTSSSASSINYDAQAAYSNSLVPVNTSIPTPTTRTSSRRSGTKSSSSSSSSGTVVPATPSTPNILTRLRRNTHHILTSPPFIRWTTLILLPTLCFLLTFLGITLAAFATPYIPYARYKFESLVTTVYDVLPAAPTSLPTILYLPPGLLGLSTSNLSSTTPTTKVITNPSLPGSLTVEYFATENLHCTIDNRPPFNTPSAVQMKLVKGCLAAHATPPTGVADVLVDKYTCPKELEHGTFLWGKDKEEECWRKCKEMCLNKGVKAKAGKVECIIRSGLGRCWAQYKF
ncbi:hypothetical protein DFH27DRAFT_526791 [Peziza echinospora]|nr:hypothetical protein DFH27DRAFT_526791 [Peziza echinospora]